MGLLGEGINEVIATTRFNAAPMGIIHRDGTCRMILFRGSHTAQNVEREGWIVANLTHDPMIWVRTALEDLEPSFFEDITVRERTMHRLRECEGWIAFGTVVEHQAKESLVIRLTPLHEEIRSSAPLAVNRGFNSLIEATVHTTRYLRFGDPALRDLIDHHAAIVRKCGGRRELAALERLMESVRDADFT